MAFMVVFSIVVELRSGLDYNTMVNRVSAMVRPRLKFMVGNKRNPFDVR